MRRTRAYQNSPGQYGYLFLPGYLQTHFGHAGLVNSSNEEEDIPVEEEKQEGAAEETKTGKMKDMSNFTSAELVFPFKSIPLGIAGIPKLSFLYVGLKSNPTIIVKLPSVVLILLKKLLPAIMYDVIT